MLNRFNIHIIISLSLLCLFNQPAFTQNPTQKEMEAKMKEVINDLNKQIADLEKQIAEAKKNKEDPETIKDLEEQLSMLKKQVEMMGGVTKGLAKMPDKTIKQAIKKKEEEEDTIYSVPNLDKKRIGMMPKDTLSDAQLIAFIKNIHSEVERLITKEEKEEASKAYAIHSVHSGISIRRRKHSKLECGT